jgi:sigma-70-like protein
MRDLIADLAYEFFVESNAITVPLVALVLVVTGVVFHSTTVAIPLVVLGSGMFFLGTMMPTLTEFQISPGGFSAKLRERDKDFRTVLGPDAARLVRTGTWLAGGPEAGKELVERALAETYMRWPQERLSNPVGAVRERMVELAPPPRQAPPMPAWSAAPGYADELLSRLIALPVAERSAVVLHLLEGMDTQMVASVTRRDPGTVAADLARGAAQIAPVVGAGRGEGR